MSVAIFNNICGKKSLCFRLNRPYKWLISHLMNEVIVKGFKWITPAYKLTRDASLRDFIQVAYHIENKANEVRKG